MNNKFFFSGAGLLVLAVICVVIIGVANVSMRSVRMDLTQNHLYTMSDGTKHILESLEQPVELNFFYSNKLTKDIPDLRNYATRVKEFLEEYELRSGGKITLNIIDPEPFSDDEDRAAEFGLQGVPIAMGGDEIYFGLAGTAGEDRTEVIPFFQPDKEEFLEYDISQLVYRLSKPKAPVIGLLSSLQMRGGFDMNTRQPTPPWMILQEMQRSYEVRNVLPNALKIDPDIDMLMVVHPKELSPETLYAIDQYVLNGGKAIVMVDPFSDMDTPMGGMMADPNTSRSSNLPKLFDAWGIEMKQDEVLGDAKLAMMVSVGQGRNPQRHLGLLSFTADQLPQDNVMTSQLETINFSSAGILAKKKDATINFEPIIQSTKFAAPLKAELFQFLMDPETLSDGFTPTGERYTTVALVSGEVNSAFPDGAPKKEEAKEEGEEAKKDADAKSEQSDADAKDDGKSEAKEEPAPHLAKGNINVLVIADTDVLSDRLWVRVQDFFGQRIAAPWANNGDFIINALDHMSGSSDLISIRSRGKFSRPFTLVQQIQRDAEEHFRGKEKELVARLDETEKQLSELQSKKTEGQSALELSPEQEDAVMKFQKEKIKIRKDLRDVKHQLNKNIESLGNWIKLLNIIAVPLVLTVIAIFFAVIRARRRTV